MPVFSRSSPMPATPGELFAWHARPGAFERLVPPWERIELPGGHPGVTDGSRVTLRLRQGPLSLTWVAEHRDVDPPHGFVDEQVRGPFARWVHRHRFLPASGRHAAGAGTPPESSVLEDHVEFDLPFGALGNRLGGGRVRAQLERTFAFRHRRTREDLERHRRYRDEPRLRVAVTGASGLVGSALTAFLTTGGHEVVPLVRRPVRPGESALEWDPAAGRLDAARLEGIDAMVHLAAANVGGKRWTPARKAEIRDSRLESAALLARSTAGMRRPPRVLVVASGIGYYGTREDAVDESASPGTGFLAGMAEELETALGPAKAAGVRVVVLRIGIVLSARGGMLARLAPLHRLGAGAVLGPGTQPVSWIALDDLVAVIHRSLFDPGFEGPVNAVAPEPVSQAEFSRTLSRVLGRPRLLRVPAFVLRKAVGEMADALLLGGAPVRPRRLREAGFAYAHPDLDVALRRELGRDRTF